MYVHVLCSLGLCVIQCSKESSLSYYRYVQSQSKFGQDACVQGYDTTIVMRLIYCTNNTRHTSGTLSRVLWACQIERVVASGVDNVTTMEQVNLK